MFIECAGERRGGAPAAAENDAVGVHQAVDGAHASLPICIRICYAYIYIYIYTYICMYVYMCIHIHISIHIYIYICIPPAPPLLHSL